MGFEESMIEDGFTDEEAYLEHLLDLADEQFYKNTGVSYNEYLEYEDFDQQTYEDRIDEYEYVDVTDEERDFYRSWRESNLEESVYFSLWVDTFFGEGRKPRFEDYVDKLTEYLHASEIHKNELKNHYRGFYEAVVDYLMWKRKNPMYSLFLEECINVISDEDSYDHEILNRIVEYNKWKDEQEAYEQYINQLSELEKQNFYDDINECYFDGEKTQENILNAIRSNTDYYDLYANRYVKDENDVNDICELYYYMVCVDYWSSQSGIDFIPRI